MKADIITLLVTIGLSEARGKRHLRDQRNAKDVVHAEDVVFWMRDLQMGR